MRYLILIRSDERIWAAMSAEEKKPVYDAYFRYSKELREAGAFIAGESLENSEKGAHVQVKAGKRVVRDGPFTEAKELVGGYYVIRAASLAEAVEWASKCPAAQLGGVEVREIEEL
jgi:hypothetical protein